MKDRFSKTISITVFVLMSIVNAVNAQNVNIPDANFKAYLVSNLQINTNADGEIQVSEANAYTGEISVGSMGIADLTGIEYFTSIYRLDCRNNQLTQIDVSANVAITDFSCQNNQLTTLDVSSNTALEYLYCPDNLLTVIDVSANTALIELGCYNNPLVSINVTGLTNLEYLDFSNCQVGSIDLSTNSSLSTLYAYENQLTEIDVSSNMALNYFECNSNLLSGLDLSANNSLEFLNCSYNQITDLILAPGITDLYCTDNLLSDINLSSLTMLHLLYCGINRLTNLDLSNNPLVERIECPYNNLTALNVSDCPALLSLYCQYNQISGLDVSANTSLQQLFCAYNALTVLNVKNGNNVNMFGFDAENNPGLSCIQVDNAVWSAANWFNIDPNAAFNEDCSGICTVHIPDANFRSSLLTNTSINTNADNFIQCSEASTYSGAMDIYSLNINNLTGIEAFTAITSLNFYDNNVTIADLTSNVAITELYCHFNQLTTLNITNLALLQTATCSDNQLTNINTTGCTSLNYLEISSNLLPAIDLTTNIALDAVECGGNLFTALDLSGNPALTYIDFRENPITSIDFSQNPLLDYIGCDNTGLEDLNLSFNPLLTSLWCRDNQNLSRLNIQNGYNADIVNFYATNCPNLTCIQVDDEAYSTANWTNIDATSSFSEDCQYCTFDLSISQTNNILSAVAAGYSYQWVDCDNNYSEIPGANQQDFTLTQTGNYAVIIYDGTVCTDTSDCFYAVISDVRDHSANNSFVIYPNPNKGRFSVITNASGPVVLVISNPVGQVIFTRELPNVKTDVELDEQPAGIYFYTLEGTDGWRATGKIVLE